MFDDDKQDFWEVVSLTDDEGNTFQYHIIEEIEIDEKIYFIALPEDIEGKGESLVILEEINNSYIIVKDSKIIEKLEKILEEIAIEENIESITLLNNDGTKNEYDVVDKVEFEGKKYIIAIDISNNDQFVVFGVENNNLVLIDNDEFLAGIINLFNKKNLRNFSYIDLEDLKDKSISITLEDNNGNPLDVTVLGKLEIKGREYLITLSPNGDNEFVAVYIDNIEDSVVLKNETSCSVNYYLKNLKSAINRIPASSPELN